MTTEQFGDWCRLFDGHYLTDQAILGRVLPAFDSLPPGSKPSFFRALDRITISTSSNTTMPSYIATRWALPTLYHS